MDMRDTSKASTPHPNPILASPELDRLRQELAVSLSLLARFGDPVEAVRTADHNPGLATDGFTVVPVQVQHHFRGCFCANYDKTTIDAVSHDFDTSGFSEAIRNIYQHGHNFHFLPDLDSSPGEVHGVVALKEIAVPGSDSNPLRVLITAVMDGGPGIFDPAQNMIDGVGSIGHGEQGCGMGYELTGTLVYVIRSSRNGWFVFDGHTYSKNPHKEVDQWSPEAEKARVDPVGAIDLPSPGVGCQKIFFFPLKTATDSERKWITEQILAALMKPAA